MPAKKKSVWPYIGAVLGFLFLLSLVGLAALGMQRVKQKRARADAAFRDMEKTVAEERNKVADSIEKGEMGSTDDSVTRMKQQLEKSAEHLPRDNANATRALAAYLGKLQANARDYETALNKVLKADVLSFSFTDQATLDEHRQMVVEFAAANDKLADSIRHSEDMARAELVAAKVPDRVIESTMNGFNKARGQRQLQLQLRAHDKTIGEASLATFDLLKKNWGRWSRDQATGSLRFQDTETMNTFNELFDKIQKAATEQAEEQKELARQMRVAPKQ